MSRRRQKYKYDNNVFATMDLFTLTYIFFVFLFFCLFVFCFLFFLLLPPLCFTVELLFVRVLLWYYVFVRVLAKQLFTLFYVELK